MKKYILLTSAVTFFLLVFGCSSGGDDGPTIIDPTATTLIFPDNNQECNEGTDVSATESSVTFRWNSSEGTDTYDVVLKNLNTQTQSTHTTSDTELAITILKATPYSWYVISNSNSSDIVEQSPTWKFYNAGDAVESYAPFPADLMAPSMGQNFEQSTTSVTLMWAATDIDGDIENYDVLFDTANPPVSTQTTNLTATSLDVDVSSGNTYYWRVITNDMEGNNSESQVFQFRVN